MAKSSQDIAIPIITTALAVLFVMVTGNLIVASGLSWYALIEKPSWVPPEAIFTPVWLLIYVFVGYAAVRLWTTMKRDARFVSMNVLLFTGIFLYYVYVYFFFVEHALGVSILASILLAICMVILATLMRMRSKSAAVGLLLVAAWLVFATYLTYSVWQLNEVALFL